MIELSNRTRTIAAIVLTITLVLEAGIYGRPERMPAPNYDPIASITVLAEVERTGDITLTSKTDLHPSTPSELTGLDLLFPAQLPHASAKTQTGSVEWSGALGFGDAVYEHQRNGISHGNLRAFSLPVRDGLYVGMPTHENVPLGADAHTFVFTSRIEGIITPLAPGDGPSKQRSSRDTLVWPVIYRTLAPVTHSSFALDLPDLIRRPSVFSYAAIAAPQELSDPKWLHLPFPESGHITRNGPFSLSIQVGGRLQIDLDNPLPPDHSMLVYFEWPSGLLNVPN